VGSGAGAEGEGEGRQREAYFSGWGMTGVTGAREARELVSPPPNPDSYPTFVTTGFPRCGSPTPFPRHMSPPNEHLHFASFLEAHMAVAIFRGRFAILGFIWRI